MDPLFLTAVALGLFKLALDLLGGDKEKAQELLSQAAVDRANLAADEIERARGLK